MPLVAIGAALMSAHAAAAPAAHVEIEASEPNILESSSFQGGTYRLRNDGSEGITGLRIDLGAGPAMFPDLIFDPTGLAGNELGLPFTVNSGPSDLNATATYLDGTDAEGYRVLDVAMPAPGLAPGKEMTFSIDVDPTVVKESFAGPHGKISGAEHHGATITVSYVSSPAQSNDAVKVTGSDIGSTADFPAVTDLAPVVSAVDVGAPAVVSSPTQGITVEGPAGAAGFVLVAEGHLYLAGLAGFDVDPFEANVLVGHSQYAFTIGADGTAVVPVSLTRRDLATVPGAPAGGVSEDIGLNYITAWLTAPAGGSGPVSDPIVLQWDGTPPPPDPEPKPEPTPVLDPPAEPVLIAVPDGPLGLDNCRPAKPEATRDPGGGSIALSASQLRINQRIGQAAIRRLNAVQKWLDDGIVGSDLCGGTLGPRELASDLMQIPGEAAAPAGASPRPLEVAPSGGSGAITLTPAQLQINQRIYRAALLRARALDERLRGRLTGGDVVDASVDPARLAMPVSSGPPVAGPAPSTTARVGLGAASGRITLSSGQLRINQRIGQRAVREANSLVSRIERGLVGANFAADTITSADVVLGD